MKLENARVLLTGAAGGIGTAVASELLGAGAKVLMTDLSREGLDDSLNSFTAHAARASAHACDITMASDRAGLVERAGALGINALINVAGVNPFGFLEDQPADQIDLAIRVNLVAPILLCKEMLPVLEKNRPSHIVNVGSSFGAIGFPCFTTYSATKFAIRGFSEALRRELASRNIGVHYVAPRATNTRLATDKIKAMNAELNVGMDTPEAVARAIAMVLREERPEWSLGAPERLYARINAFFPRIVDRALRRQMPIIRRYARDERPLPEVADPAMIQFDVMETRR